MAFNLYALADGWEAVEELLRGRLGLHRAGDKAILHRLGYQFGHRCRAVGLGGGQHFGHRIRGNEIGQSQFVPR